MSHPSTSELPLSVKERLLEFSDQLPEAARSAFVRNAARRIQGLADRYENTLVYAAVGWVVGEIMDQVLTIPFTEASLTADNASQVGMMVAGLLGFGKDRKRAGRLKEEQGRVLAILREEFQSSIEKTGK